MRPLDVLLEPAVRALLTGMLVEDRRVSRDGGLGRHDVRQRLIVDD